MAAGNTVTQEMTVQRMELLPRKHPNGPIRAVAYCTASTVPELGLVTLETDREVMHWMAPGQVVDVVIRWKKDK